MCITLYPTPGYTQSPCGDLILAEKMARYEKIAKQLQETLVSEKPGSKLGSVRQLMDRYGIGQATVERSLSLLESKGLVDRVPGRGVFVSNQAAKIVESHDIDLCFFFKPHKLVSNPLFSSISTFLLAETHAHGHHLNIFVYEEMGEMEEFKKRIQRNSPRVVILLCVAKPTFELALTQMGIPSVSVFPNAYTEDSISILINNNEAIRLAVDHLADLGHQRIAMLHGQGYDNLYLLDQEQRIDAFYANMQRRGLLIPPYYVRYGGFEHSQGYNATIELLEQRERPTAIICNDYNAQGVYDAIESKGLSVPDDISVIGFDDVEPGRHCRPALTTISIELKTIVKQITEISDKLALGHEVPAGVIHTPVKLIERKSTTAARP